jgi:hypothetical protein
MMHEEIFESSSLNNNAMCCVLESFLRFVTLVVVGGINILKTTQQQRRRFEKSLGASPRRKETRLKIHFIGESKNINKILSTFIFQFTTDHFFGVYVVSCLKKRVYDKDRKLFILLLPLLFLLFSTNSIFF